jgi:hypothetical protein
MYILKYLFAFYFLFFCEHIKSATGPEDGQETTPGSLQRPWTSANFPSLVPPVNVDQLAAALANSQQRTETTEKSETAETSDNERELEVPRALPETGHLIPRTQDGATPLREKTSLEPQNPWRALAKPIGVYKPPPRDPGTQGDQGLLSSNAMEHLDAMLEASLIPTKKKKAGRFLRGLFTRK